MIEFSKIKTILFDYDGTLHNSIIIYEPAFKKAYEFLAKEGKAPKRTWSTDEITYWLGFNSKNMWQEFLPDISQKIKMQASNIIKEEMRKQIEGGVAVLYPGALEILEYLKNKGFCMVFISNCGLYYMETHNNLFQLDRYFDHMICSEQYDFIPKYKILKKEIENFPRERVIIGDRIHDIETGIENNIYTIGCRYGFGSNDELRKADLIIEDIKDLIKYF